MPPGGLFNVGFRVRMLNEENRCEGLGNPYEITMSWVIKLV